MCLGLVGGFVYMCVCFISYFMVDLREMLIEINNYEFLLCFNQFKVKGSFFEKKKDLIDDIFIISSEDNIVSLFFKDYKFLDIMEIGVYKNK